MMKATLTMLAVGLLCLMGRETVRADTPSLQRNDGGASFSNLKFTGEAQTDDIRWRRGYYGYGGYGHYGYGYRYGYRPYYYAGYARYNNPYYYSYANPYYPTVAFSYGYGGYPYAAYGRYPYYNRYGYGGYRGGYRRIDMTEPAPAATNLGVGPVASAPKTSAVQGPIRLTQFVPYEKTRNGLAVRVQPDGSPPTPSNGSYPYDGGPKSIVPFPNSGGMQQFYLPPPVVNPERPTIPRDGLPVSLPREMSGEVFAVVYHDGPMPTPAPASTTVMLGQSSPRIAYPAYGEAR